jgi:hypothetical protein
MSQPDNGAVPTTRILCKRGPASDVQVEWGGLALGPHQRFGYLCRDCRIGVDQGGGYRVADPQAMYDHLELHTMVGHFVPPEVMLSLRSRLAVAAHPPARPARKKRRRRKARK